MLKIERHGSAVLWTIARPESRNSVNRATLQQLSDAIDEAGRDETLRAAILTGEGDAFCSGGDLREVRGITTPEDTERFARLGEDLCARMAGLPIPVLAAIPGVAFGGGAEIALACDIRIAEQRALLSFKQVRMAVTSAWGTVPRVLAAVGSGNAARALFTGQEFGAEEARALGLVDTVCDNGTSVAVALAWARDIAQGSRQAVAAMKALLLTARTNPSAVRDEERNRFVATWTSAEHADAVEAYFERRPPKFSVR
ncbi:enoyl-CoA hydratase/isomerase family protein [Pendulispora rubella]|uniref:Enoyl-CoA hydratase/isomerase family protein n=1 Tax=Pendulispora rubella TaxID=2741070 RepID=A0ABZ2LK93_9BACT